MLIESVKFHFRLLGTYCKCLLYFVLTCAHVSIFQLLKAWGANVTVVCSGGAQTLMKDLGADDVIDYTAASLKDQLKTRDL